MVDNIRFFFVVSGVDFGCRSLVTGAWCDTFVTTKVISCFGFMCG